MRLQAGDSSFWYSDWLGIGPLCSLVDYVHISDIHLGVKDAWEHGGWNLNRMMTIIPNHIRALIAAKMVPHV